jgi:hypothetical protein
MAQALAGSGAPIPVECANVEAEAAQIQAIIDRRLDKSDVTVKLDIDGLSVAAFAHQWEADTRACFAPLSGPVGDIVTTARQNIAAGGTPPQLLDLAMPDLDADDRAIDQADPTASTVTRLFAMASARRKSMSIVVTDNEIDYPTLRFFSEEEEADDAAVRIIRQTGGTLNLLLNVYSPTFRTECQGLLASGQAPEYGGFVDAHHGLCWRFAHINDLDKALTASCSAP